MRDTYFGAAAETRNVSAEEGGDTQTQRRARLLLNTRRHCLEGLNGIVTFTSNINMSPMRRMLIKCGGKKRLRAEQREASSCFNSRIVIMSQCLYGNDAVFAFVLDRMKISRVQPVTDLF